MNKEIQIETHTIQIARIPKETLRTLLTKRAKELFPRNKAVNASIHFGKERTFVMKLQNLTKQDEIPFCNLFDHSDLKPNLYWTYYTDLPADIVLPEDLSEWILRTACLDESWDIRDITDTEVVLECFPDERNAP